MADPGSKTAERIARTATAEIERARTERQNVGVWLTIFGTILIAVGIYFLVINPGEIIYTGVMVANLQRLTIGETASISGAILFSAGAIVRYT